MIEAAEIAPGDRVLEVGAGSGYAAAVLARIAGEVFAIERHGKLADAARERIAALGYDNVDDPRRRRHGRPARRGAVRRDPRRRRRAGGAGGAEGQLAVGGRLVIPVGEADVPEAAQASTRTRRRAIRGGGSRRGRFVPLIGEQGWPEDGGARRERPPARRAAQQSLPEMIAEPPSRCPTSTTRPSARLFDRFADRRVVLLGEASHGTREFYRARAAITRRLVEQHGFTIVAVEADWPDAAALDRYVRHRPPRDGRASRRSSASRPGCGATPRSRG